MSDKTVRGDIYNAISKSAYKKRTPVPMGGQRDTLEYASPRARFQPAPVFKPLQGSITAGTGAGYTMGGKRKK